MKEKLLKHIVCPNCKKDFELKVKKRTNKEVEEGFLKCKKCKSTYMIKQGIPIILSEKKLKDFSKTRKNWENWWRKVRKKSDIDLYEDLWNQAEKNLGGEPLYKKEDLENKIVLDAGCGNGRYIKSHFSKFNCKEIIAVDLGRQVFEAKKQNNSDNTHFIQTDLTNLPFKDEIFDVITSHGVLHHTPKPKKTFYLLSKHLKKNGLMAIYVYHKEWQYFKNHKKSLFLDAIFSVGVLIWQSIRTIISRMPHLIIMFFVYLMAIKATTANILEKNKFTKPIGKLVELIPPFAYLGVNFHERLVRNYDHYSATFNYFQTIEETIDWFEAAGFNDLESVSVPVSIRGRKNRKKDEPTRIKQFKIIEHIEFRKEWERIYEKRK
jgi:2-polyprenyl-3-methyl-5-hydroxy-6-metoxy-1,4-benzoquinol methylase